ncbi:hypothetical protein KGF57_003815 [Candida theae]|uniref:Zn(2)-C6 fungal-type domain-containing protein n=1 Tax=Candida theae TaxID=1198502 RepID=A0AAD5BCC6_9ASCO|nr:uncharacterized protein KGF57_003815 [Candida theae]KAI5954791.1 hypothetical protein KGF57_003815 [Candida theae]
MDFCYNRSMGNGTVASKFKLTNKVQSNQSNLRTPIAPKRSFEEDESTTVFETTTSTTTTNTNTTTTTSSSSTESNDRETEPTQENAENSSTHHPSNCNRCYRLKKKCTRAIPKCSHCERTGSQCEYVDRTKKRKKSSDGVIQSAKSDGQLIHIASADATQNEVDAHKLISVSSLLIADQSDDQAKNREKSKHKKIATAALASSARRALEKEKESMDKINYKTTQVATQSNIQEEFITMKEIKDDSLPLAFALNYFNNFGHKYPFINKDLFLQKLKKIDFSKDSIVNLDIYLLLSIGCILYDAKTQTSHYSAYFKTKSIYSIIDVLDLSFRKYNQDNIHLLLLLSIYGLTSLNNEMVWNLIGLLNRAVLKFDLFKKLDDVSIERVFWSIHNLDKEISVVANKPSQFPRYAYIEEKDIDTALYEDENLSLVNYYIALGKIQDSLADAVLSHSSENLTSISSSIGSWVSTFTKDISLKYVSQPSLQELIPWINIQSYYMQTVMDQVSTTKSFQFPSNFIFHSFTSLISASDKSLGSNDKLNTKVAIVASGIWYAQLFDVIRYSTDSLIHFLKARDPELSYKIREFNEFLQQDLNLLKYIRGFQSLLHLEGYQKLSTKVNETIEILENLGIVLLGFDEEGDNSGVLGILENVKRKVGNSF